jgi:hypothetical protein
MRALAAPASSLLQHRHDLRGVLLPRDLQRRGPILCARAWRGRCFYAGDDRAALDAIGPLLSTSERMRKLFQGTIQAKGAMDPYHRSWRLAWAGSRDEALSELEEAFRRRSTMMPLVASDPAFASIRKEPRFRKVVYDMGL